MMVLGYSVFINISLGKKIAAFVRIFCCYSDEKVPNVFVKRLDTICPDFYIEHCNKDLVS